MRGVRGRNAPCEVDPLRDEGVPGPRPDGDPLLKLARGGIFAIGGVAGGVPYCWRKPRAGVDLPLGRSEMSGNSGSWSIAVRRGLVISTGFDGDDIDLDGLTVGDENFLSYASKAWCVSLSESTHRVTASSESVVLS